MPSSLWYRQKLFGDSFTYEGYLISFEPEIQIIFFSQILLVLFFNICSPYLKQYTFFNDYLISLTFLFNSLRLALKKKLLFIQ